MRKTVAIVAGLLLLLTFAQCKKNKINENQESEDNFELACDAGEYIDDNIQSQLDLLSDKTTPEAMAGLAEWIRSQEGVRSAVAFNNHVDIVYVNGSKGSVEVYDQTLRDDNGFGKRFMAPFAKQEKGNLVGNQKVFIYDAFPYVYPNIDEADSIKTLFEENGFEVYHLREEECAIDSFIKMFQYGYVQLITHGRSDAIATGEIVTRRKLKLYRESMEEEHDLIRQYNLIIKTENGLEYKNDFFCVTDKYIRGLQGQFDDAIIFNSACEGFVENSPLREAFCHME